MGRLKNQGRAREFVEATNRFFMGEIIARVTNDGFVFARLRVRTSRVKLTELSVWLEGWNMAAGCPCLS